uniref:Uncharacterized protein n=1 Tax=Anguilla anguilla TaxID=7936 RepID=A0A0E9PYK4_ANGAN
MQKVSQFNENCITLIFLFRFFSNLECSLHSKLNI